MRSYILCFALISLAGTAFAETVTYNDNVCALDPGATADDSDCALIQQTATSAVGLFELELTGLDPNISGPAIIGVSAGFADIYQNDEQIAERGGGRNNPDEYFAMSIDDLFIGVLFDDDDSELPSSIFDDVVASIESTGDRSTGPFSLSFSLSEAVMAPLVSDGAVSLFLDFSFPEDDSHNVNFFSDVEFSVDYDTREPISPVPLPAAGWLLLAGIGGLGLIRRSKSHQRLY